MKVRIINLSNNPLPAYQTDLSAGMDLQAYLPEGNIILKPMQRLLVKTGLFIELPKGYEAQIRSRSGLSLKHGIVVLNAPGTIDADYRGEIGIILANFSTEDFEIKNGERIAQMVIAQHETISWEITEQLTDTQRGIGGFGSTGK